MKIYTKTNVSHGYLQGQYFANLKNSACRPNDVYWYDCHDFVVRGLHIKDFLEERHWQHLRSDPTSKFLIFHPDEFFNYSDIDAWVGVLKEHEVPPGQCYFVLGDENWVNWFNQSMNDFGFIGYHVCHLPLLMGICHPRPNRPIINRFSLLSRNYQRWRLNFFLRLLDKDLLKDINYTYNNLDPYGMKIFPHEQLIKDAEEMGFNMTEKILDWISGIPYTFKEVNIQQKFNDVTYNLIQTSGINVTVESQCDPHWFWPHWKHIEPNRFSVAFPTEKTFKAISCSRPFIIVSSQNFLEALRQLGFKTFHPWIDESYDKIDNLETRFEAVASELDRLRNLPDNEYAYLLDKLQPIADYNLEIMKQRMAKIEMSEDFGFLKNIVNHTFLSQNQPPPGLI